MTRLWRLLAIAAALNLTVGAARAAAQTVLVRNAPPGITVEIMVDDAVVGTGTTSPTGEASLDLKLPDPGDMDANVYVDVCEKMRRVVVIDRNKRPSPQPAGCDRREISGVFQVKRINTLVVDVGGLQPSMLLIKGTYKPPKPAPPEGEAAASTPMRPLPTRLTLFGCGGVGTFHDAFAIACGNAVGCTGHDGGPGYSFGSTVWITRWLGAEGGYEKPRQVTAKGGDTFSFNSAFGVDVFTVAAMLAVPAGPVRIYGLGGANYHQSTLTSSETIDTATQSFAQKTHGWGWLMGAGTEVWATPKVAIYGELSVARVKGKADDKGEGLVDDHLRFIAVRVRIRLSR